MICSKNRPIFAMCFYFFFCKNDSNNTLNIVENAKEHPRLIEYTLTDRIIVKGSTTWHEALCTHICEVSSKILDSVHILSTLSVLILFEKEAIC